MLNKTTMSLQTNLSLSSFCIRDPFRAHREHMRQMMRSFSEPFGGPVMPSITDGRRPNRDLGEQAGSSQALRGEHRVSSWIWESTLALFISSLVDPSRTFVYDDNTTHQTVWATHVTQSLVATTCALCTKGGYNKTPKKSVWM